MIAAGGLHIVGTERHESRRIDNQLRGRAGRQGDPGSSRFYLSLEDPLLRIFGGERLGSIMQRLKMPEGEPIEHPIVNRSIAKAQNRVESRNFDIRKQLLEYDDVANDQRRVIYQQRNELLESTDIADTIRNMIVGLIDESVKRYIPPESIEEQWDVAGPRVRIRRPSFQLQAPVGEWLKADPDITDAKVRDRLTEAALAQYASKEAQVGPVAHAPIRAQPDAADARPALARSSREPRPSAAGHSPSRVCAEKSEAGVQARIVRALLRHARPDQAGRRQGRADGPGAHAGRRAGGRGSAAGAPTSSISTRTTMPRSPRSRPIRRRRPRRSCAQEGKWDATIRALAGPEKNTSSVMGSLASRRASAALDSMPVRYTPPAPDQLLPVSGVRLGTAAAKIKRWQRDDLLLAVFDAGHRTPPACSPKTAFAPRR